MKTKLFLTGVLFVTGSRVFAEDSATKMSSKVEACMKNGKTMDQCAQMNNMDCSMMNGQMSCEMMKEMHKQGGMMGQAGMPDGKGMPNAQKPLKDTKAKAKTEHNHETHKDEPVKDENKKD